MTERATAPVASRFADLPGTAASHFQLYFYAAVSQLLAASLERFGSEEALYHHLPQLSVYDAELRECGVNGLASDDIAAWWRETIACWESGVSEFLPVRALRDAAGVDHDSMVLVFVAGLIEEDTRFGSLFEVVNEWTGQPRPTVGCLTECFAGTCERAEIRARIRGLQDLGVLTAVNPEAPRLHQALEVPGAIWDAMRGMRSEHPAPWARYRPPSDLTALDDLVLADALRGTLTSLPALLRRGNARAVIVRGPQHNGRRTVLGAIARALGLGTLDVDRFPKPDDERWRQTALLATVLRAMPLIRCDPGPGETADIPRATSYAGPIGIAIGRSGGVSGGATDGALTVALDMPDVRARRDLWLRSCAPDGATTPTDLDGLSARFRMTSGNLHRTANLARSYAAAAGRAAINAADVQQAARALNRQALDTLAEQLVASGDWRHLAARDDTLRELINLERRCRHRERLATALAATEVPSNCGVRALFRGPSGTGKTLAARLLAGVLQMDVYRLDLASIINKYIGETEKNLDRVLSRAEELDVMLLVDEGDSLLTQRTNVQSANDRYANLETNFLLQRLEHFDGIIIVTTNAGDRIDTAFERRMDVVVEFVPPQAAERWDIWQIHLPTPNAVDRAYLSDVATRCALGGGQIRNAVLHASLLALDAETVVDTAMIDAAVRREYRKLGALCPLRSTSALAEI